MLTMNINHPDIEEFIEAKQDLTKVTGANISVMVTDEFMKAVENNEDYILRFPIDTSIEVVKTDKRPFEYNKLYPFQNTEQCGCYYKKVKAKELWDKLMHCAWNTAEPGIVFKDTIDNNSPDGVYPEFKMVGLNPCAEQALGAEDACRLIHVNLTSFVENPFTKNALFNKELFRQIMYKAVQLGDDLVDLEIEAIERIIEKAKKDNEQDEILLWEKFLKTAKEGRRIGLGFTGLADTLAMMNLQYDSEEALKFVDDIMFTKYYSEINATIDLAESRGAFPNCDRTKEFLGPNLESGNDWYKQLDSYNLYPLYNRMMKVGRRNLTTSTVAPTGTVSIMAQCSSGIEPVFMPFYERKVKCMSPEDRVDYTDKMGINYSIFIVVHPKLKEWAYYKQSLGYLEGDIENFNLESWKVVYVKSPYYKSTAQEINWKQRIKLQGIIQKYVTNAISSTVNLPKETKEDEISTIYLEAWKHKLKGVTIYRDSCREGVLNSINNSSNVEIVNTNAPKRPKQLEAIFYTIKVKKEQFVVLVGLLNNKPYEIFTFRPDTELNFPTHKGIITKQKKMKYSFDSKYINIEDISSTFNNIEEKAATLYTSMLLRHGVDINYITKTAKKVNDNINSFSTAMCRILSKYAKEEIIKETCPDCGSKLIKTDGCIKCLNCGYSKCS